jgi:hypothetical protein
MKGELSEPGELVAWQRPVLSPEAGHLGLFDDLARIGDFSDPGSDVAIPRLKLPCRLGQ